MNADIRIHVAKPLTIIFMTPLMLGLSLAGTILSCVVALLITPAVFVMVFLVALVLFGLVAVSVTAMEPHIDTVLINRGMRLLAKFGVKIGGYPTYQTQNYWPSENAVFHS